MSMAEKIALNAQKFLEPGEMVQGAFAAQYTIANRLFDGGYVCVVATDRRFMVFRSGVFSQTKLKELLAVFPRSSSVGSPEGLFYDLIIGGVGMKVNFRYFDELRRIEELRPEPGSGGGV